MNKCECTDYETCKYCLMSEDEYYDIQPITMSEEQIESINDLEYFRKRLFEALRVPVELIYADTDLAKEGLFEVGRYDMPYDFQTRKLEAKWTPELAPENCKCGAEKHFNMSTCMNCAEKKFVEVESKFANCECGGEKCGTTHSDWCPKFRR